MIYYVRHGKTEWNVLDKMQGKADISLNDTGINQAKETRKKLEDKKIDLIICSPLKRAKETANIINEDRNIPIVYDERIGERDLGEFEGLDRKSFNFSEFWDYYKNTKYQKAENIQEFFKRIYDFLDEVKNKYSNMNILIVSHGGVSMPVFCYFNKSIPNGSLIDAGLLLDNCEVAIYK